MSGQTFALCFTHPSYICWLCFHVWPCRCRLRCAGVWRTHSWSDGSASPLWKPDLSGWHPSAPLHPSSAGWWCQGGGSHSHDKSGHFFGQILLDDGCTPEPWVVLVKWRRDESGRHFSAVLSSNDRQISLWPQKQAHSLVLILQTAQLIKQFLLQSNAWNNLSCPRTSLQS